MGVQQRVSGFTPTRGDAKKAIPLNYSEVILKCLPSYLAMGMSYEQYMTGEIELVKYYREAHKLKLEYDNAQAWMQGRYFYDALIMTAPMYAFKPSKPQPYHNEPYPINKKQLEEREIREAKEQQVQAYNYMHEWAKQVNNKKGGENSGSNH